MSSILKLYAKDNVAKTIIKNQSFVKYYNNVSFPFPFPFPF